MSSDNAAILIVSLFVFVGLFFYFLPSLIGNKKKNANTIFLVNLFFGWSAIGWIIALIWALKDERKPKR